MSQSNRNFTLAGGRVVSVESLKQWSVYAGLLEGLPTRERNDAEIDELIATARAKDGHNPFLIKPSQRRINHEGRYLFGEPAALPPICCIARLHSYQPAREPDKDCSDLTVIWFQDDYAFPLSEEAQRSIIDLDWKTLARDGEY